MKPASPGSKPIESPVVFLFFNRRELAESVFDRIRAARPKRLTLVSDGPRPGVPGESELVADLRTRIENMIDWPVDVIRDYASENLGCGCRVATGIDSALTRYGRAIILEDDCLPAASFFPYCDTLLDRFENDPRVLSITGTYFLNVTRGRGVAGLSRYPCIWGWATWARAWEGYDRQLTGWDTAFIDEIAEEGVIPSFLPAAWKHLFAWAREHPMSTWDLQFWFLCLKKRGLSVFPYRNQISNVGGGPGATHTTVTRFCNRRLYELSNPAGLQHPLAIDLAYERYLQLEFYSNTTTMRNVFWKVRNRLVASARGLLAGQGDHRRQAPGPGGRPGA